MTVLVNRRSDFSLDNFRRVAFGGEGVEIGPVARSTMAAARQGFVALLDSDRSAPGWPTSWRVTAEYARWSPTGWPRFSARPCPASLSTAR